MTNSSKIHGAMFRYNYYLGTTRHDVSKWWSWPLMTTPIFYWMGSKAGIYFFGNPVVWCGGSLAFLTFLVMAVRQILRRMVKKSVLDNFLKRVPVVGFFIAFLSYTRIPRVLFMYHYLPPLLFFLFFTMLYLDRSGWIRDGELKQQHWSY